MGIQQEKKEKKEGVPEEELKLNLDTFRARLAVCEKEKSEYLAGWQRARADLLNYKKEETERMGEFLKYANEGLMMKILPILDNFDLIEKKLPSDLKDNENVRGILQVKTQIQDLLKNQGVEEIRIVGERFDPNFHEVVEEVETQNQVAGLVVEEVQKGYTINGRLLRPAKVKVAK